MKGYSTASHIFTSPRGAPVVMTYRKDTSDWNTIWSCLNEDEYGLAALSLSGQALDVGAHIGGVTIGLLADNPHLHVTAIEAVPENAELLRINLAENGLTERAVVLNGAAGKGKGKARIHYRYTGTESAEHHAFIGNIGIFPGHGPEHCPSDIPHQHAMVPIYSLTGDWSFMKIDCEGGEWDYLTGEIERVARIHGEWHPTSGHVQADFTALLSGFVITYSGPDAGPQGFTAERRMIHTDRIEPGRLAQMRAAQ